MTYIIAMLRGLASLPPLLAILTDVETEIPVVAELVGSTPEKPVPDSSITPSPESLFE